MQAQFAYAAINQLGGGRLLKRALELAGLLAFGLLMLVAVLVSSITSGNDGLLATGPQYQVTGSVMPPASLQAVFQAAADGDGYYTLTPSTQRAIAAVAKSTGTAMPCVLPWQLLAAESYVESSYHTTSVSGAGAVGIMQFEPTTFYGYSAMVGVLHPSGGVEPPSPTDAPDAIYAADILLCGDGATSGAWSVGDVQAVGQYNCGGTWITNPSACVYHGFTTTDYVDKVHAVFDAILAKAPLGSSSQGSSPGPAPGNQTSPSTPAPGAVVQPSNPLAGSLAASASELIGQKVNKDSSFIYGVCQLASNGSSLPPPSGSASLTDISTHPSAGDFAETPWGLGVVVTPSQVVVVRNGVVASVTPAKGWSYGIDPAYT